MDDVGGMYKRGFSTGDFQTEAQSQQLGIYKKPSATYGAGIPISTKSLATCVADIFEVPIEGSRWTTTSKLMSNKLTGGQNGSSRDVAVSSNLGEKDLQNYREQWTTDTALGRNLRYQTESRRSTNVVSSVIRLLPGTPKSLEHFRERLLVKYGILGLSALRYSVGSGIISCSRLSSLISKLDVKLNRAEFDQVHLYYTYG